MDQRIIYVVIILLLLSFFYLNNKIDKLAKTTTEGFSQQQASKVDFESIRNLSNIARELQRGGLNIPGNVRIHGELDVSNNLKLGGNIKREMM